MTNYKYTYIITSERAHRRNEEYRNELRSNCERNVGDVIYLDGLAWTIEDKVTNE